MNASGTASAPNEASRLNARMKTCGTSLSNLARSSLTPRLVSRATIPRPSSSTPASNRADQPDQIQRTPNPAGRGVDDQHAGRRGRRGVGLGRSVTGSLHRRVTGGIRHGVTGGPRIGVHPVCAPFAADNGRRVLQGRIRRDRRRHRAGTRRQAEQPDRARQTLRKTTSWRRSGHSTAGDLRCARRRPAELSAPAQLLLNSRSRGLTSRCSRLSQFARSTADIGRLM